MFAIAILSALSLIFQSLSAQSFSLYPTVDPTKLASAFNISVECLDALNTTLPCDPTLLQMTVSVDNYWWETDNLTTLCTNDCYAAVQDWNDDVAVSCYYDTLVAYNKVIPAASVADRFAAGMSIACVTNQNATDDLEAAYCLIESQNWVGSDIVRPDCTANPTDPACSDPTNVSPEHERMANLYDDDVLCSECFIQMMHQRVISPYLPDHDFSDYLIAQYQDILDVCNYTQIMPELIVRALPDYADATPVPLNFSGVPVATTSCATGQYIVPSTLDASATCATIAQAFNVATGSIQEATNSTICKGTSNYCLPAACSLYQVKDKDTCASLATAFSTTNLTVSTMQLLTWNPDINGLCDSLTPGDYICSGPPGGSYVPPPATGNASDQTQQRGGGDSSSTSGNGTLLCTKAQAPSPLQDGIDSSCTQWCQAVAGDYCFNFAQETNITTDGLYKLNPVLGAGGSNCTTQFQAGYWYCVEGPGVTPTNPASSTTTTAATPTSTSTGAAVPSPTQSGIVSNCNKYKKAVAGDYCYQFAADNSITTDELYAWNTILGSGGANCATLFQAGEYYCVGVGAPGPTQTGIAANCNKWTKAVAGDYCYQFAADNNITTDELYAWNTVLGSGGANCATLFQAGEYYCVGVSS